MRGCALSLSLSLLLTIALNCADIKYRACFVFPCSFSMYLSIDVCSLSLSLLLSLSRSLAVFLSLALMCRRQIESLLYLLSRSLYVHIHRSRARARAPSLSFALCCSFMLSLCSCLWRCQISICPLSLPLFVHIRRCALFLSPSSSFFSLALSCSLLLLFVPMSNKHWSINNRPLSLLPYVYIH